VKEGNAHTKCIKGLLRKIEKRVEDYSFCLLRVPDEENGEYEKHPTDLSPGNKDTSQ
jgi:hypothetical protein